MCPENTYSLGGSFRISGDHKEWNNNELALFGNNCVFLGDDGYQGNICEAFKVTNDNTTISAGENMSIKDTLYYFELTYGVHLKKPGKVIN